MTILKLAEPGAAMRLPEARVVYSLRLNTPHCCETVGRLLAGVQLSHNRGFSSLILQPHFVENVILNDQRE